MRVVIAGAGSVGRSIARELLTHDHEVTLIDRAPEAMKIASVADAEWLLADACELGALEEAGAGTADVAVAATGDDKANLVISLLAKTEFGVPRVVARINNPKNEWMFDSSWGVDVPVSTPRIMTSLVEEAVSQGDMVQIFSFHSSGASIHTITLPPRSPAVGTDVGALGWDTGVLLSAIIRDGRPLSPRPREILEEGDELVLVVDSSSRELLEGIQRYVAPAPEAR